MESAKQRELRERFYTLEKGMGLYPGPGMFEKREWARKNLENISEYCASRCVLEKVIRKDPILSISDKMNELMGRSDNARLLNLRCIPAPKDYSEDGREDDPLIVINPIKVNDAIRVYNDFLDYLDITKEANEMLRMLSKKIKMDELALRDTLNFSRVVAEKGIGHVEVIPHYHFGLLIGYNSSPEMTYSKAILGMLDYSGILEHLIADDALLRA